MRSVDEEEGGVDGKEEEDELEEKEDEEDDQEEEEDSSKLELSPLSLLVFSGLSALFSRISLATSLGG